MKIAHVASEVAPYCQTGGLAQVASALPEALARLESGAHEVAIFCPLYRSVFAALAREAATLGERQCEVLVPFGARRHRGWFRSLTRPSGLQVHFFDCPELFERNGIYGDENGDFEDNGERFSTFCRAVLDASERLMGGAPDVFHCHDWQTGLLPVLMGTHRRDMLQATHTVFTIHNLAYQGYFPKSLMRALRLPWSTFTKQGLEFYDQVNALKAGVAYATTTTTVSESYAEEIRTPEFGCHLEGFLREDCPRLLGLRNGIDVEEWNPATDAHIAHPYSAEDLEGKDNCRRALLKEYGLEAEPGDLLVGVVSRLAGQKGLDLVAEIVPELHDLGIRLVLVGNGETALEERFRYLASAFKDNLSVYIGFDAARAHRVFAGADAFLMPSRFEPCGLGQMAAMQYGTVPVVHAVGGLRDTVIDAGAKNMGNGFRFEEASIADLRTTLSRAATLHRKNPKQWEELVQRGMRADWSWTQSAQAYLRLYRDL